MPNTDSEQNRNTYDKIASDYYKDHKDDTWDNDFLEDFIKHLPLSSKILDLGCGPGIESKKMSDKDIDVCGMDLSPELIKIAKEHTPKATFIIGNMLETFPFVNNSFDGVFAKASLLHIPKDKIHLVIKEMARVLKTGGIIHIAVKKGDGEHEVIENDYGYEYKRFFSLWQPEELSKIFQEFNLKILSAEQWQNPGKKTIWLKYILQK